MKFDRPVITIPRNAKIWSLAQLPQSTDKALVYQAACIELYRTGKWAKLNKTSLRIKELGKLCGLAGSDLRAYELYKAVMDFDDMEWALKRSAWSGALKFEGDTMAPSTMHSGWNTENPDEEDELYG